MNHTKKKCTWILWLCFGIALVHILLYVYRVTSVDGRIHDFFHSAATYKVMSLEEMPAGEDLRVIDISSEESDSIEYALENTKIRFETFEVGAEITEPLYTLYVLSDEGSLSVTVNVDNKIHFNNNEISYASVNDSDLYHVLQTVFSTHQN